MCAESWRRAFVFLILYIAGIAGKVFPLTLSIFEVPFSNKLDEALFQFKSFLSDNAPHFLFYLIKNASASIC